MRVLAHVPDLMDRSRVAVAGGRAAATVGFVADPAQLATEGLATEMLARSVFCRRLPELFEATGPDS